MTESCGEMGDDRSFRLGVCYYPEHWPPAMWEADVRRMAEIGISRVRIGEFAWSCIEPEPGAFAWDWLDRAIDVLAAAGHGIILGTPTATPPKWLVDRSPEILAHDADGQPRKFGSRRHYCFSSPLYRAECARITSTLATRYGRHPALAAWQIDNEYGCHDTVLSYSPAAAGGFRKWLAARYGDVGALNAAWGAVFWSGEYRGFAEVDPPNLTVTEANPAHVLDYRRFASDEVLAFHRIQADIVRAASPDRPVTHNLMGFYTGFDHHRLGAELDVATWDSYPLGFTDEGWFDAPDKLRYARQGHPDLAAFHHDLYRGCSGGRWWVMEQQPGPVNWAANNPAPLPGMVRLWTVEAYAHGAELVSFFRWRQAPFGQEQMHAGLLRPDDAFAPGAAEAAEAGALIGGLRAAGRGQGEVALVFGYEAQWMIETQPQGAGFDHLRLAYEVYTGLRRLGLDVDIVAPGTSLAGYRMAVVPCLPFIDAAAMRIFEDFEGPLLFGPRCGSKSETFSIPPQLAPGPLQALIPLKVVRVESLRPGLEEAGNGFTVRHWLETVETDLAPELSLRDGRPVSFRHGRCRYLAAWPDAALIENLLSAMTRDAGVRMFSLPPDLRTTRRGDLRFLFNHGPDPVSIPPCLTSEGSWLAGGEILTPAGFAVWRELPDCP